MARAQGNGRLNGVRKTGTLREAKLALNRTKCKAANFEECSLQAMTAAVNLTPAGWNGICTHLRFSRRETQITCLILANHSEYAIAEKLAISPHTVHSHLDRLYRKLSIGSRCELIVRLFAAYIHLQEAQERAPVCAMQSVASICVSERSDQPDSSQAHSHIGSQSPLTQHQPVQQREYFAPSLAQSFPERERN